ncbi:MAG: hypothetical protein QOG53_419 [Frankiales bacterium]|nr:hypothetical protein [Frankiales bacterium]
MAGATGGVGVVAGIDADAVRAAVEKSCAAQGLPIKVADPVLLRRVEALLTGADPRGAPLRSEGWSRVRPSHPPHGTDPVGIEGASTRDTGTDDGMVEHGADDGVLPSEVEIRPLSA